uniref:Uncharacterized protein n=1 Tax=Varanus komodoensis TaxID=61221 RepID=A0A8D2IVS4_VARKO
MPRIKAYLLASLFLSFILPVLAQNPGIIHISPEKGGDYCFLFPSQWMRSYQGESKNHWLSLERSTQNLTYSAMCCLPSFFGEDDNDGGGLSTRIASVREGNCNLYENARLHQINGTQGLLTLGGDTSGTLYSGTSAHELNPFQDFGHNPNWL